MRRVVPVLLVVVLGAAACTGGGDDGGPSRTTSTTRPTATTRAVNTALPPFDGSRAVDDRTTLDFNVFVATDPPGPRYCLGIKLTYYTLVDDKTVCGFNTLLEMYQGPVVDKVGTFFGVTANNAVKVRVYDKDRNVIDATPDRWPPYPYQSWAVVVPSGYRATRAVAFDIEGRELHTAKLRSG